MKNSKQIKLKTDKFGNTVKLLVPKVPINQGEPRKQYCIFQGVLMTREDYVAYDKN